MTLLRMLASILLAVVLCLPLPAWAQTAVGGQLDLSWAAYTEPDQLVAFSSRREEREGRRVMVREVVVLDVASNKQVKAIPVGQLDRVEVGGATLRGVLVGSQVSPDGKRVCIIGTQYQARGQEVDTVLHLLDVSTQQIQSVPLSTKHRVQRVTFHPTDPNLLGLIAMDQDFNYVALTYNLSTNKVERTLMQGRGALIPMFLTFSGDGARTYVGYGSSSYQGGFNVYTTQSGARVRQVALKDQPHYFFEVGEELVVSGLKNTYFYDLSSIQARRNIKGSIGAVHAASGIGVLIPNGEIPNEPIQIFDFGGRKRGRVLAQGPISGVSIRADGERVAVLVDRDGGAKAPIMVYELP